MKLSDKEIKSILNEFEIDGDFVDCKPYGNGHINSTFLVTYNFNNVKTDYIFQGINSNVFKNVDGVMKNIKLVTDMLKEKASERREVLTPISAKNGEIYIVKDNNYFRVYEFVTDSICIELPKNTSDFYECGYAFGKFQRDLSDFSAEQLFEVIPDFHNTVWRYENLIKAEKEDIKGRASKVKSELDFAHKRKDFYSVLADANKNGELPLRVSHNDTKCNNVLLDKATHKALCVIDLDTIMPGFSVTDFGDAIRFGASTASEDEKDLSKVSMDLNMFEAYTNGFLDACGEHLSNSEIMLLPEGAKMMTIECGMRFLTDYLQGDTYFKTAYAEHNLDRCRTQFKLVEDMENKWQEMKDIVKKHCNK